MGHIDPCLAQLTTLSAVAEQPEMPIREGGDREGSAN